MDQRSIAGYAVACRTLYDALAGVLEDGELLADLESDAMKNPQTGIASLHFYATANRCLSECDRRRVSYALGMVDPDARGPLTDDERGLFTLYWWNPPETSLGTMTTAEAAETIGVTTAAVSAAAGRGDIEGEKVRGSWVLDEKSVLAYRDRRNERRERKCH